MLSSRRAAALVLLCVLHPLPACATGDLGEQKSETPAQSGSQAFSKAGNEPFDLEVLALANEGFLLRAADDAVVIDAFVSMPYAGYGALSGEPLEALLAGTDPFDSVDIALASHEHGDHFQPSPARNFLAARSECLLASSPQVLAQLDDVNPHGEPVPPAKAQRRVLPAPGEEERVEVGSIRIDILRLSHGSGRFAGVENLGHVITLGGVTALHVGDAAMEFANFEAYGLRERGIDVVFVPYWYFKDSTGRRIINEHFRPAKLIACHISPSELSEVTRQLARTDPDVLVPQKTFESFGFRNEHW